MGGGDCPIRPLEDAPGCQVYYRLIKNKLLRDFGFINFFS